MTRFFHQDDKGRIRQTQTEKSDSGSMRHYFHTGHHRAETLASMRNV